MRERLDVVHMKLNRKVVAATYEFDTEYEDSEDEGVGMDAKPTLPSPSSSSHNMAIVSADTDEKYIALLRLQGRCATGSMAQRSLQRCIMAANDKRIAQWLGKARPQSFPVKAPKALAGIDMFDINLFQQTKSLFYKLLYPELAAMGLTLPAIATLEQHPGNPRAMHIHSPSRHWPQYAS